MSTMTKVRVINSTDPRPALAPTNGPQTAGIYFDRGTNSLKIDADTGVVRSLQFGGLSGAVAAQLSASALVPSASAATADNYGVFFTAPFPCRILSVTSRHETAGSDGGAVTLQVHKVPSGTAKTGGQAVLSAGLNLKATANVNQAGSLSATPSHLELATGDSLSLVTAGVLTAVDGVSVAVHLVRL